MWNAGARRGIAPQHLVNGRGKSKGDVSIPVALFLHYITARTLMGRAEIHAAAIVHAEKEHLGVFADEREAARAVDRACIQRLGLEATTSFPLVDYLDILSECVRVRVCMCVTWGKGGWLGDGPLGVVWESRARRATPGTGSRQFQG